METEKLYCYECGAEISDDNYEEIDGEIYCADCVDEYFVTCDNCGEYVREDDTITVQNGDRVCEDCINNYYVICDDCGEYVHEDDSHYLSEYDTTVCDDCLDANWTRCNCCGEWISNDDAYHSDCDYESYCETCYYDTFTTCSDCGCEIYRDDAEWIDDEPYCSDCACEHEDSDGAIYSYHGLPVSHYVPRYHDVMDNKETTYLYGLELEVSGSCSHAQTVVDMLGGNAVLMYDSSVDGFEIVHMPMSREYIYKDYVPVLSKVLQYLRDNGFNGHNYGGIHVHFTKLNTPMQVANMTRIMYGSEDDRKLWLKITQRKESQMHWCSMTTSVPSTDEIIEHNIMSPAGCGNHGTALNYCSRTNTHELRIFNSNLRLERVLKNLECVFALQDYVVSSSEPTCDTRGFINFVDKHASDYPHLTSFFFERNIFSIAHKLWGDTYETKPSDITVELTNDNSADMNDDNDLDIAI